MSATSVWEVSRHWWKEVAQKVKRAVVYLDTGMAEQLHWSGGMGLLLQAGAQDVREFSSFESGQPDQQKAVFLVSSTLTGVTESVVRDVVTSSNFQYVVLCTTISPLLHPEGAGHGDDWEAFWEEALLQWMGNMNYTAEVRHIPMFGVEVCSHLFITPTFSDMFPLLPSDVKQVAYQHISGAQASQDPKSLTSLSQLELSHLPTPLQSQIQELSSGLHALLQSLDVREDIYSVGHTARLVATQLDLYPPARARRKATQNRASLVLIDRSLDLAPALTHQADTLLDRLTNTLAPLPGHRNDRLVDMTALTNVTRTTLPPRTSGTETSRVMLPGSLAPTSPARRPSHLTSLVLKKQKEAVMEVNRHLVEAAAAEKLPLNLAGSRPGRVSADSLDTTLALFRGKYPAIRKHLDLLQVAMATSQSLRGQAGAASRRTDAATAAEKNLVQALCEGLEVGSGSPSGLAVLARLVDRELAATAEDRELTLDDLLGLLALTFSLSGSDCGEPEEASDLQDKIVQWIIQEKADLPPLTRQIIGDQVTESILRDQVENIWERLEALGAAREDLYQFSSVLDPGDDMTPASARPLLIQMMEAVLDPARPDLTDVECKSGGLGNLLKSGFGFFKGSGKPRPGDAPLLIVFLIGGVTSGEVRQVKDMVDKAAPQFEVLLGSTRLSSITSTLESVFVKDNVNVGCL